MRWRLKPLAVGRIFGIPLRISYSWFPVFALHIYVISHYYLHWNLPHLPQWAYWALGTGTTVLLFLSVLGHELGHAIIARIEGLQIYDITLHLFGGLARFDRDAKSPAADFRIAIAGPSSSFLIGVTFFILNLASIHLFPSRALALLTNYLGLTNLILALFNLLPGYPLDGGRVLRAWLWARRGEFLPATRRAAQAGGIIAYILIGCGLFWIITWKTSSDLFIGGWFVIIGIFVKDAATGSLGYLQSLYGHDRLRVKDAMSQPVSVSPDTTLEHLICDVLPQHRQTSFPVTRKEHLDGILVLERIRSIPRHRWPLVRVCEVMLPVTQQMLVHPLTTLAEAQSLLMDNEIGSAGVIDEQGSLVGYIGLLEIHKALTN